MNSQIFKLLSGNPVLYRQEYKLLTNSLHAGVMLSQCMYWFSKKDSFYKTDADFMQELGFTEREFRTAKKHIKSASFLKIQCKGIPKKTWYIIDWVEFESVMCEYVKNENDDSVQINYDGTVKTVDDGTVRTITKTTAKTTTNINMQTSSADKHPDLFIEKKKSFKQLTQDEFWNEVEAVCLEKNFSQETASSFYLYWTEPSASGKMKFQLSKTWDTKRRLRTWTQNNFSKA